MTLLLAVLGCGARAPVAPATWIEVEPGKAVCLSGFPGAPDLGRRDARTFHKLLGTLEEGEAGEAARWLGDLPEEHPAVEGVSAVLDLVRGELGATVDKLDALSEDHPEDACLGSTAALALWASGDFDRAALRLRDARTRAPNDGHIAFLSWFLALEPAEALLPALQAGVAAHPDDPGLRLALGAVHLELMDAASAVPHLEAARDGGMADAEGPLLQAYFLAGQRGPYLREASRLGLPLGDHGAIADAEDPVAAYDALLGVAPGQTLQAVLHTSLGDLTCTLLPEVAPVTVANFVGLARGTITWVHPATGLQLNTPLYDGTVFHRVIPDFMIQGGDPLGQGVGDPGYNFIDELDGSMAFDRPGLLAMANKGPHTNGSQFFVTETAAPHLDGLHTIFGTCDERSVDVVRNIARVPVDDRDAPIEPVVLEHVEIQIRTGEDG